MDIHSWNFTILEITATLGLIVGGLVWAARRRLQELRRFGRNLPRGGRSQLNTTTGRKQTDASYYKATEILPCVNGRKKQWITTDPPGRTLASS